MAAKRQKPPAMLQGHRQKPSMIVPERNDARPTPLPPAGLRKAQKDAWLTFWQSDLSGMVNLETDMDALSEMFRLMSERDALRATVNRKPLIAGSMGQLVLNPLNARLRDCTRQVNLLREHFGLTPLSRMRLGLAIGQAHDALSEMFGDELRDAIPQPIELDALTTEDQFLEVGT